MPGIPANAGHWGQTAQVLARGEKLDRWHWVYTATCFRLEQRVQKAKRRAVITECSYAATREGSESLMRQLHAEARRRGLADAERVLVIADGAVWIGNAVEDRFGEAVQRFDLVHANAYLWAVANQLHEGDPQAARAWVKPYLHQLRTDQVAQVIESLEQLQSRLSAAHTASAAQKAKEYYRNNQKRMKYQDGQDGESRGEPLGSGAIGSTCWQPQCRFKRGGQFWSTAGDEALLCLETFWRNERWEQLFPDVALTAPATN